ncbi:MAG: PrsW family intramembrane metalloprotease [Thermomicrobiales bacterium]
MRCPKCTALDVSGEVCPVRGAALPKSRQRRRWVTFLLGAIFALMTLCVAFLVVASIRDPIALILSVIAAVIPAALYSYLVVRLDHYEQEPRRVLLATFAWGAVGAVLFSIIAELITGTIIIATIGEEAGTLFNIGIGAPIIEETFKGLALLALLHFFRQEFDNVLDGIVYGALVGLGFAMTENMLYFGAAYLEDGPYGLGELFIARAVINGFGHALYTGTIGAAVGWSRSRYRQGAGRVVVPMLGWFLAVFQHFLWNTGVVVIAGLQGEDATIWSVVLVEAPLFVLPALIILGTIAVFARRHELEIIRWALGPEVARGVLTPEEFHTLSDSQLRRHALHAAFQRAGEGGRKRQQRFFQVAAELAFRKYHLSRGERPKPGQRAPEDVYREELATLRAELVGTPSINL